MRPIIILILCCTSWLVLNAQETDDPARPVLGKTGQVFSVKLTPQNRRLEVALAGKPAVTLDPQRLTVFGKVYPSKGEPTALRIQAAADHFEVLDKIDPSSSVELEVKDRVTKKSETLRLKQNSKP